MRMRFGAISILTLALAGASAAPAPAQNRGAMMLQRQQAMVDTVVAQLALSEEKEQAFRAVMAEQAEAMLAVFESYEGRRDPAMRDSLLAIQAAADTQLETILTEDEMTRFMEIRAAHREQMRQSRRPPG